MELFFPFLFASRPVVLSLGHFFFKNGGFCHNCSWYWWLVWFIFWMFMEPNTFRLRINSVLKNVNCVKCSFFDSNSVFYLFFGLIWTWKTVDIPDGDQLRFPFHIQSLNCLQCRLWMLLLLPLCTNLAASAASAFLVLPKFAIGILRGDGWILWFHWDFISITSRMVSL